MNNINFETFVDEIDIEFKWRNLIFSTQKKLMSIQKNLSQQNA